MYRRRRSKKSRALAVLTPALLSALVLQTAPASAQATSMEHLRNGGFEAGRTGWEAGAPHTQLRVVTLGHGKAAQLTTSRRSAAVVLSRPNAFRASQKGQRLVGSAWVRSTQGGQHGRLVIAQSTARATTTVASRPFRLTSTWKRVSVATRAASKGALVELRVRADRLHKGQRVHVDGVRLASAATTSATVVPPSPVTTVSATSTTSTIPMTYSVNPNGRKVSGVYVGRDGTSVGGTKPYESPLLPSLNGTFTFKNLRSATTYTVYAQPVVDGVRGAKTFLKVTTKAVEPVTTAQATASGNTASLQWTVNPNSRTVSGVYVGREGADASGVASYESPLIAGLTGTHAFRNLRYAAAYTLYVQPVVNGVRGAKTYVKVTTDAPPAVMSVGMANGGNTDPSDIEARAGMRMETRKTYYQASQVATAITTVKGNMAAGRDVSEISFKLPTSWAEMAAGKGDVWAKDLAGKLKAAVAGTDHVVRLAFHHEPEDDTGTNPANTAAGRDAWKAMQVRLAPFFESDNIQFVVILMGYHSLNTSSNLYSLWNLPDAIPTSPHIEGVGYDLYETRGVIRNGVAQGWRDWDLSFSKIKQFHATRPGLDWGISETGVTATAFAEKPTWFTDYVGKIKQYDGTWFTYFNSTLNSVAVWGMEAGGPREKAFLQVLSAHR